MMIVKAVLKCWEHQLSGYVHHVYGSFRRSRCHYFRGVSQLLSLDGGSRHLFPYSQNPKTKIFNRQSLILLTIVEWRPTLGQRLRLDKSFFRFVWLPSCSILLIYYMYAVQALVRQRNKRFCEIYFYCFFFYKYVT